jgi:SAM-dependent methyltransferase
LVTVAQGAHWFKRDAFLREAHRVLKPTGTLALFGYGFIEFPTQPTVTSLIREYADGLLGPYWEPGRLIVDRMYRDWSFGPYFDRVERHEHRMEGVWSVFPDAERLHTDEVIESGDYLMDATEMSLNHLKHYLGTWSAYKRYLDAHPTATDPLDDCLTQISQQTNIHDWNAPLAITFPHVLILASNSKP